MTTRSPTTTPTTPDEPTVVHARCGTCQPTGPGRFLALCGAEAVAVTGVVVQEPDIPADRHPCPNCRQVFDEPCIWCGNERAR